MTYTRLRLETHGAARLITLERPEALNAIDLAMEADLRAAFAEIAADREARAVVLTGAGRAFSVGVDLTELAAGPGMDDRIWHGPGSAWDAIANCGKPIISAVNGFAVTGGLELALTADFLIAGPEARFADTHARVGITPGWGLSQVLPRLIGPARARQMSLTGAFVRARQALDWGLVNEVVEADQLIPRALALANEIAETEEAAMTVIRDLMREGQDLALTAALVRERAAFDQHMTGVTTETIAENRKKVQARGRRVAGGAS